MQLLLFFLIISSPALYAQHVTAHDREISLVYSGIAYDMIQKNEPGADELLSVSLEFDQRNADAVFLLGQRCQEQTGKISLIQCTELLTEAIANGVWTRYHKEQGIMQLVSLYDRLMEYESMSGLLEEVPRENRGADWYYFKSRALSALEKYDDAVAVFAPWNCFFPGRKSAYSQSYKNGSCLS